MGGVVGRYYVSLAGGDGVVANLVTIGSPHTGTEISAVGLGHPTRELLYGSAMLALPVRADAAGTARACGADP